MVRTHPTTIDRKDSLVYRLTVNYTSTLLQINQIMALQMRAKEATRRGVAVGVNQFDDIEGHYLPYKGEQIGERYAMAAPIGAGTFGVVWRAWDTWTGTPVAVKIVKADERFSEKAREEGGILSYLLGLGAPQRHVVGLLDMFEGCGHVFLIFELLGDNLQQTLRQTNMQGLSLRMIRNIGRQLFDALAFLREGPRGVLHGDVKPENIVFSCDGVEVKLIDFGLASTARRPKVRSYFQTRYYRSPEVILGLPSNSSMDMWSAGCVLAELHTSRPLFESTGERNSLALFQDLIGKCPEEMIRQSPKKNTYFRWNNSMKQYYLPINAKNASNYPASRERPFCQDPNGSVAERFKQLFAPARTSRATVFGHTDDDYEQFIDLLARILTYCPSKRLTPCEALRHPFFTAAPPLSVPDESDVDSRETTAN